MWDYDRGAVNEPPTNRVQRVEYAVAPLLVTCRMLGLWDAQQPRPDATEHPTSGS